MQYIKLVQAKTQNDVVALLQEGGYDDSCLVDMYVADYGYIVNKDEVANAIDAMVDCIAVFDCEYGEVTAVVRTAKVKIAYCGGGYNVYMREDLDCEVFA